MGRQLALGVGALGVILIQVFSHLLFMSLVLSADS